MTDDTRLLAISVFAGEVVLAVAAPDERAAVIERFRGEPDFAAERRAWERRLAPLASIVPRVIPSPGLWPRIAAETVNDNEPPFGEPGVRATGGDGVVVGLEDAIAARTRHLQSRVTRWRWATAAVTALAAGLAAFAILGPRVLGPVPAVDQRYVAVVNATGELPPLVVSVDVASGELTVQPVDLKPEAGKAYELWAVPSGEGAKPVSLGLVARPERRSIATVTPAGWRDPNLLLAVSVEPPGGSPTGAPTGPVVYKGKLIPAPR